MALRDRFRLIAYGFLTAALLAVPKIPRAASQEPPKRGTPLKDVCPVSWSRYDCGADDTRVCVSPDLERQYDLASSTRWMIEGCPKTPNAQDEILPEIWTHATPEEIGYRSPSWQWGGYSFVNRVVNFDSSMVKNDDLDASIREVFLRRDSYPNFYERYDEGFAAYSAHNDVFLTLESYGLQSPKPRAGAKDVCPAEWARFSCTFVRLCVSPCRGAPIRFGKIQGICLCQMQGGPKDRSRRGNTPLPA